MLVTRRLLRTRRGPRYERDLRVWEKAIRHYDGSLQLRRRAPTDADDVLLQNKLQETPLFESCIMLCRDSLLDQEHWASSFGPSAPRPLLLPDSAFADAGDMTPADALMQDPMKWCPSRTLWLDAVIIAGGYEPTRTDFDSMVNLLCKGLPPPLRPWAVAEELCLRINLCPAVLSDAGGSPKEAVERSKKLSQASWIRSLAAVQGHDVLVDSMRKGTPLESVEFVVGFSNGRPSTAVFNRISNDADRDAARPAFGASTTLLAERLHSSVWKAARTLHALTRLSRGATDTPPFAFWISAVAWYVADGHDLLTRRWDAAADECQPAYLRDLGEDVMSIQRFVCEGHHTEGATPEASHQQLIGSSCSSTDLLRILRSRSQPNRGHPSDQAMVKASGSAPRLYIWRNFFLPLEDFTGLTSVALFKAQLRYFKLEASPTNLAAALRYVPPLLETPPEYFRANRLR